MEQQYIEFIEIYVENKKNLRKDILLLKMDRYWLFGYANTVFISKSIQAWFIWWPEILLYQQRRFNHKSYYMKYYNMVCFVDNWKYIHSITVWLFFFKLESKLDNQKNTIPWKAGSFPTNNENLENNALSLM